jgi:hypothetical protein
LNIAGSPGFRAFVNNTTGTGGSSILGGGALPLFGGPTSVGNTGGAYGGGGSGAATSGANINGGAGAAGVVIVEY